MEFWSVVILLFMIMDPIGNVPLYLSVLETVEPARRRWVLVREILISLVILYCFLFVGKYFLQFFALRPESISIAGAIVLLMIAIRMIFPQRSEWRDNPLEGEPFIVPLAVPFFAGPSILATIMLLTTREPERMAEWSLALFIAWAASAVILLSSNLLYRALKKRGLIAMERLMGMLLVAIAVQMFLDGFKQYLQS